jgi:hypothetical protein
MAKQPIGALRKGGAIRLTLSARVANDLGALQEGLASLAERLGHTGCATGCDILDLMQEREYLLSDAAALNPQPLPPAGGPTPDPWQAATLARQRVVVTIPDRVNRDIRALQKAIGVVVGKLGCGACCSGFDILFRRELQTMVLDEKLKVVRYGGFG